MPRHAAFTEDDFFAVAARLVAEEGPAAATVVAIARRAGAPTGSLYHRFASRDELLGALWLRLVERFQAGFLDALARGDGLEAALYTSRFVREHPDEARALLLYRREDFADGRWPDEFQGRAVALARALDDGLAAFARRVYGEATPDALRRVTFALVDVPAAAVRRHLTRDRAVPPVVDELVRAAVVAILPPASAEG